MPGNPGEPRLYEDDRGRWWVRIGHRNHSVSVQSLEGGRWDIRLDGVADQWSVHGLRETLMERMGIEEGADATSKDLRAPMPGKVLEVLVQEGQSVEEGEAMLVLEAMKMENVLRAGAAGVVSMIGVEAGNAVEKEAVLISMEG
jgi:acetyl/propionyl-CoA carboxylase alpha subunit